MLAETLAFSQKGQNYKTIKQTNTTLTNVCHLKLFPKLARQMKNYLPIKTKLIQHTNSSIKTARKGQHKISIKTTDQWIISKNSNKSQAKGTSTGGGRPAGAKRPCASGNSRLFNVHYLYLLTYSDFQQVIQDFFVLYLCFFFLFGFCIQMRSPAKQIIPTSSLCLYRYLYPFSYVNYTSIFKWASKIESDVFQMRDEFVFISVLTQAESANKDAEWFV